MTGTNRAIGHLYIRITRRITTGFTGYFVGFCKVHTSLVYASKLSTIRILFAGAVFGIFSRASLAFVVS